MYHYGATNYSHKKEADGSVTVVATPSYDGMTFLFLLPVFEILFGLLATAYNIVTLNFDAIAGLWNGIWTTLIITLMVVPVLAVALFVYENVKKH